MCFRTHGGRILRHNAVCRVLASGLRDKGWEVTEEPHIPTRAGIRKPDLVAAKDDRVCVIDSQVVSGQQPLSDAHKRKVAKHAEDLDVRCAVRSWRGKYREKVDFSTCTVP